MRRRSWSNTALKVAVSSSKSVREVLVKLKLVPAGGNYVQIQREIRAQNLSTKHFFGKGWRRGSQTPVVAAVPIRQLLKKNSEYQSYKLKKRLYASGLKRARCEECGWSKKAADGRTPLELDHKNGTRSDNRLSNLRILCPNCHSLKPTHRGRNKKVARVA